MREKALVALESSSWCLSGITLRVAGDLADRAERLREVANKGLKEELNNISNSGLEITET